MTEHTETETETTEEQENENGRAEAAGQESRGPEGSGTEAEQGPEGGGQETEPEKFPRSYVEKLRDENAKYRQRAQRADDLAKRLHTALVASDGRLADPTDLEFTDGHLEDAEALSEAIGELIRAKPHLAARKPLGSIGQGAVSGGGGSVDLAGLLRSGAN